MSKPLNAGVEVSKTPRPGEDPEPAEPAPPAGGPVGPVLNGRTQSEGADSGPAQNAAPRAVPLGVSQPGAGGSAPSQPSQAQLLGLPDELPMTWCPNCEADVKPKGKGLCPRCGRVLKGSFLGRKHPVNVLRRDQLLAENIAEYRPDTLHLRRACRWLANITERLESVKDGTPEHQRLVAMWTELTATLEASRTTRQPANIDSLTHDQLIERTTTMLRHLLEMRDNEQRWAEMSATYAHPDGADGSPSPVGDPAQHDVPVVSAAVTPAPEPVCPYCRRPCIGPTHSAYAVLHWDDPVEIERREKLATDEMFESLRRANRGGDPYVR